MANGRCVGQRLAANAFGQQLSKIWPNVGQSLAAWPQSAKFWAYQIFAHPRKLEVGQVLDPRDLGSTSAALTNTCPAPERAGARDRP